jgi:cytochrome c biogenesis protein CcdA
VRRRAILGALFFAAGMLTVFVSLGASASALGQLVREWFDVLRWVAAALIIVMGLHFLGVLPHRPLEPAVAEREWATRATSGSAAPT